MVNCRRGEVQMKDLFISHASEDKEELVRPLAERLRESGMDIWYDEFSINPGDSISASIDKGLIACNFGLIVISKAFLEKKWTEYELRSLLSKEVNKGKTIIPIWHKVNYEQVADRSLYLADKKAIDSSIGIGALSFEVIKTVRPDIINSYALKQIGRKLQSSQKVEERSLYQLQKGEIVHQKMPQYVVLASKLFDSAFPGISSHREILEDFARDYDYDEEFLLWCIITAAYWDTVYEIGYLPSNDEMHEMLSVLLGLSLGESTQMEKSGLPDTVKLQLGNAYLTNAEKLFSLSKRNKDSNPAG